MCMKKLDLQPTDNNIRDCFIKNTIGRNKDILNFIRILDAIDENYSIALDSYWGSGKTFFVKQVKMILDSLSERAYTYVEGKEQILNCWKTLSKNTEIKSYATIYYDAWKNDADDDPIYSLIYQIVQDTHVEKGLKEKVSIEDVLIVAGKITSAIAGIDPNDMAEALKKKDFLDKIRERQEIDSRIEEFLEKVIPENCDRLLIIIDELDRCNPSFAVKLLERIKHYFNNDKITFVFSVNLSELQITIRNYYGNEFNSSRYLDRFFDLRISLPPIEMDKFIIYALNSIPDFANTDIIISVIKTQNMQMRDCLKYISTMKLLQKFLSINYHTPIENSRGYANYFLVQFIIPILVAERICNISLYSAFISGNDSSLLNNYTKKIDISADEYFDICRLLIEVPSDENNKNETLFVGNLNEFYNALMKRKDEAKVGKCLVTSSTRELLWEAITLLSDKINLNDMN